MATLRMAFVCTGNICRSPMAAALAERRCKERGLPAVIISAGTLNLIGKPADPHAVSALAEIDVALDGHRSQGVNNPILHHADHIVVMAPHHAAQLTKLAPKLAPRIVRLWEHSPTPLTQIEDPVGADLDTFRACRDTILTCLDRWLDTL